MYLYMYLMQFKNLFEVCIKSTLFIYHQVTKKGKIIDEKTYRLNMAKKEHRKHVRDLLATAIVHKTLDVEVQCIHMGDN